MLTIIRVLCFFCAIIIVQTNASKVEQATDGSSGTITMGPPDLNDEETSSIHMPSYLKCDACLIIANQFIKAFVQAEKKFKDDTMLKESEVIDIVDGVCSSQFDGYGITEIDGKKRLKGPDYNHEVPGISQSGGRWPLRFQQVCAEYTGVVAEWIIYVYYRKHEAHYNDAQKLLFTTWLCEGIRGVDYCKKKRSNKKEL